MAFLLPPPAVQNLPAAVPDAQRYAGFLGSTSCLYRDQTSGDIYLENRFHTGPGQVTRVAEVCVGWGSSAAFEQKAMAPGVHPINGHLDWQFQPPGLPITSFSVLDTGLYPPHMIVPPGLVFPPPGQGILLVNGIARRGLRLRWCNSAELRSATQRPLHYHEHYPRTDHRHEPPEIKPEAEGKHAVFGTLYYRTQIQNFRRSRKAW